MGELEIQNISVNPVTGEVVDLTQATDQLAGLLHQVRELDGQLRTFKQHISDELHRRFDHEGTYTVYAGIYKVTGQSPARKVYDGKKLAEVLSQLVEEDVISQRAMAAAIDRVVTWKPKMAGINNLVKQEHLRERIEACAEPDERPRRASVSFKRDAR